MTTAPVASQAVGANNPPAWAREDQIIAAANKWVTSLPKAKNKAGQEVPTIRDLDTANACRDFIEQIETALTDTDAQRVKEKKPHDEAAAAVQEKFRPVLTKLGIAKLLLKGGVDAKKVRHTGIIQTWLDAEADRIAREQQAATEALRLARVAEEEAARAAEANKGDVVGNMAAAEEAAHQVEVAQTVVRAAEKAKPQAQGEFATRAISYRTYYSATIDDYLLALRHFRDHPDVKAAVQALANADATKTKGEFAVPGCVLVKDQRAA